MTDAGLKKALRVKTFIENLTFSKGQWQGQQFKLLPWQWEKVIAPAFGTIREDGNRQYRYVYVEIPKKNGKTEIGAAIALYMLCADKEGKPEIYSAAGDKEQAGLVYSAAAEMVKHSPDLKHLKILDSRKRIINPRNSGFYQVLSSESELQHGLSPSGIIFDELHAQQTDRLYNVLTSGTDYARKQQLVIVLTTAGIYDKNSIWWKIRTRAQQIDQGIIEQANFLPVLYIADPEKDDPSDEGLWKRVNPSLGQIFTLDKIREDYEAVKHDPVEFQNFLRFRLNIPIKSLSRWMPMDKWDKCNGAVDIEYLRGRTCYGGLDLASKIDLAAFVLVFPPEQEGGVWDIVCKFYCPEDGILKRSRVDKVNYDIWEKQGFLTATPGNVIDYEFIKKDILLASKDYDLREIGFDSWNATQTATDIMNELNPSSSEDGFQMVEMRQGAKTFNEPAKDLLVHVMTGKVRHRGDPVLRWNADNLVMRADANGNVAPDKQKATDKIDGLVALIMAWGRAMQKPAPVRSAYEGLTVAQIKERMAF
ncbi:MAG: terminase [Syntrophus sp. (in: bacteria)]|nr:terminase [Syntrophus sp. (in: bacteria)]